MEVLLAEVLFDGSIIQLPPADIAALLSCFVCESGISSADVSFQPQSSTASKDNPLAPRVSLASREEEESSATPTEHKLLPSTVPDHLQPLVQSMFTKAEQVRLIRITQSFFTPHYSKMTRFRFPTIVSIFGRATKMVRILACS